jgi:hypothetical protein
MKRRSFALLAVPAEYYGDHESAGEIYGKALGARICASSRSDYYGRRVKRGLDSWRRYDV